MRKKKQKRPPEAKEKDHQKSRKESCTAKKCGEAAKKECRPGWRSRPQNAIGEEGKNDRRQIEPPGQ